MLYSYNHNDINNNSTYTNTKQNWQTQIHWQLCCSGTNVLLISGLRFFNIRRETILKSLLYHTMLTTPPTLGYLVVQSQFLNTMLGPNFSTSLSDPNFSTPWKRTQFSMPQWQRLNCLPAWPTVNSQLTLFQNLQILRIIASRHDVIHTPAPFTIWGLLWQLWLSYPLRMSVNCTHCYAPELRAE